MTLTFSKWGLGSPPRLPKTQSSIAGVKTPHLDMLSILLKRSWKVDAENGLAWAIWTSATQVMYKKKGWESNWQFDSRPLKVRNRPDPGVCKWSATHHWKALEESYKFASDLTPIGGLNKELWATKSWESKPGQFRDSLGVPGKSVILM
jgi:hypothetical protein